MQPPAPGRIGGPQRVVADLAWRGRERQVPPKSLSLGASTCSLLGSLPSPL